MTKIMTTMIAFELIRSGDLKLNEKFLVSENAWRLSSAGYSSMFIMVGDEVSVENLLKGIIIASGNDACVALAEGIAGTEDECAVMMTAKAKEIKEQVCSGERSDKIRTYNYKDNRVSDHRINLTIKRLDQVLDGDLEDFVTALIADHETTRLANLEE